MYRETYIRFDVETSARYCFTGSKTGCGTQFHLHESDHETIVHWEEFIDGDDDDSYNFDFKKYYDLEAGKTYYLMIYVYRSAENETVTLTAAIDCIHSSSTQTCRGYLCDNCGKYYGERVDTHRLDTVQTCCGYWCIDCGGYYGDKGTEHKLGSQTCKGYRCEWCYKFFGEADPEKHVWYENGAGWCELCYERHDHTDTFVDGKCTVCGYTKAAALISNGVKTYYDSFYKALEDAKEGDTVQLQKSFEVADTIYFEKAITIDLNGCEVSRASSSPAYVNANVTFTDSVGNGYFTPSLYINSSCTFDGGKYWWIAIRGDFTLDSLLAPCAGYYNRIDKLADSSGDSLYYVTVKKVHTIVTESAVAPTCTSAGRTEYKYCTKCDYKLGGETVAATGHSFKGEIKNDGENHTYKCVNGCGTYGAPADHVWDNGTETTIATHTKKGVMTYTCTCGATRTEDIAKLEGHTYTEDVVAPTCTEQGYTKHTCACGDSYTDSFVPATGKHNYVNGSCADCGVADPNASTQEPTDDFECECNCHKDGWFFNLIWKIQRIFYKVFGIYQICTCGAVHY